METMNPADIRYFIIHCSATTPLQDYSVERLVRDHRKRGFAGAGYHYYIRRDGAIYTLRQHCEVGAHCRGYNRCSLGICYEGGLDAKHRPSDTRTEQQRRALEHLLLLLRVYYPEAKIVGHRSLSPDRNGDGRIEPSEWLKACPSFDAEEQYRCFGREEGGAL